MITKASLKRRASEIRDVPRVMNAEHVAGLDIGTSTALPTYTSMQRITERERQILRHPYENPLTRADLAIPDELKVDIEMILKCFNLYSHTSRISIYIGRPNRRRGRSNPRFAIEI